MRQTTKISRTKFSNLKVKSHLKSLHLAADNDKQNKFIIKENFIRKSGVFEVQN